MPEKPPTRESSAAPNGSSPFNRTAQHDAKRAAILSQAAKLFNGRGSRSTTLLDIAQGLGLTKTSLYYYVKTKEELIYQCYVAALDSIMEGLDRIGLTLQNEDAIDAYERKRWPELAGAEGAA